ncbi:MAG: HEAT repeat domain-containing protein [Deltaproteobacteria bacterium]|nr:HEAT repeat domain-containing protein [Deltaproteobacteria bacterium]
MLRAILSVVALACALCFGACDCGPKDTKYWGKKLLHSPKRRVEAIKELKKLRDPASIPDLLAAIKIPGEHSDDAAWLIGEMCNRSTTMHADESDDEKEAKGDEKEAASAKPATPGQVPAACDKALVKSLVEAIDFTVPAGKDAETKQKNRTNTKIAEALGKLNDPDGVEPLIRLLKARDNYVQLAAVRSLGAMRATAAVDRLIEVADKHDNNFMIKNAIIALGDIGDPKAVPQLIKMMFFERGVSFYREASFSLFQLGKPAVQPLIDTYEGKNAVVSTMKLDAAVVPAKIAMVLGDIADPAGFPIIHKVMAFDELQSSMGMGPLAKANAVRALGLVGDKTAVPELLKGVQDIDVSVREFPTEALGLIGDRSVLPELWKACNHEPFWTNCKKDPNQYPDEACKNSEPEVRQLSTEWFTRLADGSWLDKYKKMIDEEKDPKVKELLAPDMVRLEVAKECGDNKDCWLGKLKLMPPQGAPKEETTRLAKIRDKAGYELSYLKDSSVAPAIVAALQDPDLEARYAKVVALYRIMPKDPKLSEQVERIIADERGKAQFVKVNEELKRLAIKMARGY